MLRRIDGVAITLISVLLGVGLPTSLAQSPSAKQPPAARGSEKKESPNPAPVSNGAPEKSSEAERIARLQRSIDETQQQLDEMRAKVNGPKSEYKKAETEFAEFDRKYEDTRKNLQKLKDEGRGEKVGPLESDLLDIEKRRTLARERFDLAIKERKGLQEQITTLEQKLQQDQDALNKLLGVPSPKSVTPTTSDTAGAQAPAAGAMPTAQPTSTTSPSTTALDTAAQPPTAPAAGLPAADAGTVPALVADPPVTAALNTVPSEKLAKAEEEVTTKQAAAEEAKQQAQSVTERLESIRKAIANERDLLKTAKQKENNTRETLQALNGDLEKKWVEGSTWAQLKDLRQKIAEAEKRVGEAATEIREHSDRIDARQSELAALQTEQIAALQEAETKAEDAAAAVKKVEQLKNPYTLRKILQWLIDHGPRIVFTLVATIFLLWLSKVLEHRLVLLIARHGATGNLEDRENRARTLVGVVRNATTVLLITGASLTIVAEFGVNIIPWVGAAGVVGLAVAFGAQNLIRDYFSGFMILMENQYTISDTVRIGDICGQVERITLRITVLRDLKGTLHFVPHGQINTVSNLTHGWSRVLFDVGVAYKEDVDHVMKVLLDLARDMRRDPVFGDLILDEPEMLGVNAFDDSAVKIRFVLKTRPLKRWIVKRELNRRIKKKFDELRIEIPFPHRVVFQHIVSDGKAPPTLRDQAATEWPEARPVKR
ncbi:MAG: mechanosensitive ion channel [Phycisphaerales bacterium]|nr:mechanosensitive ion channel [Phycisphaerales bacterium]